MEKYSINSFNLTFTQGKPHSLSHVPVAPTGVQLLAWLDRDPADWTGLVNTLSGLFCASLNFMDDTVSANPSSLGRMNKGYFRYANLPGEIVCTENLTPWEKLLPCGSNVYLSYD
jgi:phosphatidylinositol glycan class T